MMHVTSWKTFTIQLLLVQRRIRPASPPVSGPQWSPSQWECWWTPLWSRKQENNMNSIAKVFFIHSEIWTLHILIALIMHTVLMLSPLISHDIPVDFTSFSFIWYFETVWDNIKCFFIYKVDLQAIKLLYSESNNLSFILHNA